MEEILLKFAYICNSGTKKICGNMRALQCLTSQTKITVYITGTLLPVF